MRSPRPTTLLTTLTLLLSLAACSAPPRTTAPLTTAPPTPTPRSALPDNRTIDTFSYSFSPILLEDPNAKLGLFGPYANFSVTREGKMYYSYASQPHTGSGGQTIVKDWNVPPKEATKLLDALVADGVLNLPTSLSGKGHGITVSYGNWQLKSMPTSMPEHIIKRLRPYLNKADPQIKAP